MSVTKHFEVELRVQVVGAVTFGIIKAENARAVAPEPVLMVMAVAASPFSMPVTATDVPVKDVVSKLPTLLGLLKLTVAVVGLLLPFPPGLLPGHAVSAATRTIAEPNICHEFIKTSC